MKHTEKPFPPPVIAEFPLRFQSASVCHQPENASA